MTENQKKHMEENQRKYEMGPNFEMARTIVLGIVGGFFLIYLINTIQE